MNIHLDKIFPTPIWSADLDIDNKELYEWCKDFQKFDIGRTVSNVGGWQSNDIFVEKYLNVNSVRDLFFAIMDMTNQAVSDYNYEDANKTIRIGNVWININNKDCYNASHVHPNTTFSGVYYVKSNEQSGKISFERNYHERFLIRCYGQINKASDLSAEAKIYQPVEGRLLLFPAYLPHSVDKNNDDSERVSISFNVDYSSWGTDPYIKKNIIV